MKKIVGVLGGMGPMSTIFFNQLMMTEQSQNGSVIKEQDFLDVITYNMASIPDRTAYILDKYAQNPIKSLIHAAKALEAAGTDFIAMPCMTAHYYYNEIAAAVKIPILHAIEETAKTVVARDIIKVGLMATDGTLEAKLFQQALKQYGVDTLTLSSDLQTTLMQTIYQFKNGEDINWDTFFHMENSLIQQDIGGVIYGCTELGMIAEIALQKLENIQNIFIEVRQRAIIDSLKILAKATCEYASKD